MVTIDFGAQFRIRIMWLMVVLLLVTAIGVGLVSAHRSGTVTAHRPLVQAHLAAVQDADGFSWD